MSTPAETPPADRAAIDRSCRGPVLFLAATAVVWLLIGTALAVAASVQLHSPTFMSGRYQATTFGVLRMAHLQAVGVGWSALAAMAGAVWLMARLARVELAYPFLVTAGGLLWNAGMAANVYGILAGDARSVEWLDAPVYVPPFLMAGVVLVAASVLVTFARRREAHVYVTQWYILAAVVWFPFLYTVAVTMIFWRPATGVLQAVVNWWFAHNYLGLWLTPIGVGVAYYVIPKAIGRPVYSYYLSIIGFWSLALFYAWAGMHHLIGGPLPAWLITASVVGSMMMFIPVIAVAINHHLTMVGSFHLLKYSPALRFTVFGAIAYTAVSAQGAVESLRDFSEVAHFTHYTVAHAHLGAYGFFAMVMFGLFYYMVPRLTGREWVSARLIRLHFWTTAVGIAVYFVSLTIGGGGQGRMMNDPNVPWPNVLRYLYPFFALRSAAGTLMAVGHVAFAALLTLNLLGFGKARAGRPAYFTEMTAAEARAGAGRELAGMNA